METFVHVKFSRGTIKYLRPKKSQVQTVVLCRRRRDESVYAEGRDGRRRMRRRCYKGRKGVAFAFRGREACAVILLHAHNTGARA